MAVVVLGDVLLRNMVIVVGTIGKILGKYIAF